MRRRGRHGEVFKSFESPLLDGAAEYINCDSVLTGSLSATTSGAWSCWIKPVDGTPAAEERFICFGDTNAGTFIFLAIQANGKIRAFVRSGGVNQWIVDTDAAAVTSGVWTQIILVHNGTRPDIYVDSIAVATTDVVTTDLTSWFSDLGGLDNGTIGVSSLNSAISNHFDGNIKDVLFHNAALSQAEVTELYNGGAMLDYKKHSKSANLVTWYKMDNWSWDGTNFTFYDEMGNNDATSSAFEFADVEVDNPY